MSSGLRNKDDGVVISKNDEIDRRNLAKESIIAGLTTHEPTTSRPTTQPTSTPSIQQSMSPSFYPSSTSTVAARPLSPFIIASIVIVVFFLFVLLILGWDCPKRTREEQELEMISAHDSSG